MSELLILILMIAAFGAVVTFIATSVKLPQIVLNFIYLIVALCVILFLIHAIRSGHIPDVKI